MSSLRWRTAAAFALLSAAIAVVMSVVVYQLAVNQRSDALRAQASRQAQTAAAVYRATGALVGGATYDDASAPAALRRSLDAGRPASDLVSRDGAFTVWAAAPVRHSAGRAVYVQVSARRDAAALSSLRRTLILTGLGVIVAGTIAGTLLALTLSRRLRAAAAAARRIADGDVRAHIGAQGRDEVGVLSQAVDEMADALRARITREQRFNADVAHELRTPVTGLIAAAALLPEDDEVVTMVRERAQRLQRLVDDLLEIARLEAGSETAELRSVDLRTLAGDVAERYPDVTVQGAATVATDPRRLERVIVNLLENAQAHGAAPVCVNVSATALSVTDAGPGFPDGDTGDLVKRFVTRTDRGHGLGLSIAAEQARVLGAELTLANAPEGGAVATVRWPT